MRTGNTAVELDATVCPEPLLYLWIWFCEVDATRSMHVNGANPIAMRDLESWARMREVRLTSFELDCLLDLDRIRLTQLGKKNE